MAVVILTVMISPIMIAISVDALLRGPARAGRRAPSRSASTAGARCGRSRCARRARRSSPAPCSRPPARSARRSCSRWSRAARSSRPTRSTASTFVFEPMRAARRDDRRRTPRRSTRRACARRSTRSRCCCSSRLRPVARRLDRQAAAEEVRARADGDVDPARPAAARPSRPPVAQRRAAPRHESISTWRWTDRIGYVLCWAAGLRVCAIAAARSSATWRSRACSTCSPRCSSATRRPGSTSRKSGGFLDPIARHDPADGASASRSPRRSRVGAAIWLVEYGRPAWLARLVESGIEIIAGTPDIVLALFGLALFQQGVFGWMSFTARGRRGLRALVPDGRVHDVADRAAAGRRRDARGRCRRSRATCARRPTRSARRRRRRSAACCCPSVRPNIATGAALGMGRIAGDTAIVVILLGATLHARVRGRRPGLGRAHGHRLDADELRLQQLARPARATRRRRPTPRRSSCC